MNLISQRLTCVKLVNTRWIIVFHANDLENAKYVSYKSKGGNAKSSNMSKKKRRKKQTAEEMLEDTINSVFSHIQKSPLNGKFADVHPSQTEFEIFQHLERCRSFLPIVFNTDTIVI